MSLLQASSLSDGNADDWGQVGSTHAGTELEELPLRGSGNRLLPRLLQNFAHTASSSLPTGFQARRAEFLSFPDI